MTTMSKIALVTGASRRLGLYIVEALLNESWQVHALTRSASVTLAALNCKQLHIHEHKHYDEQSIQQVIDKIKMQNACLDLVVNNASIYETDETFTEQGMAFYQKLIFIHMGLPAMLAENLMRGRQQAGGNIVSITDIYADNPNQAYSLYCSTKAGLQNLTLSWAKKWAPLIRANCIQPGPVKFLDEHDEQHQAEVLKQTPLAVEGGFEPIYKTLQFILDNPYLTGACIKVDGGRSLMRG